MSVAPAIFGRWGPAGESKAGYLGLLLGTSQVAARQQAITQISRFASCLLRDAVKGHAAHVRAGDTMSIATGRAARDLAALGGFDARPPAVLLVHASYLARRARRRRAFAGCPSRVA